MTIQKRYGRKSARVDRTPGSFSDINSDVSTRYKSPNDAQSFLASKGKGLLSTRRRMNQFLTPVFSPEKRKMKSLINQSLAEFNAVKCKETFSNIANEYRNLSGLSLKYSNCEVLSEVPLMAYQWGFFKRCFKSGRGKNIF